jgi:hypothetical protein
MEELAGSDHATPPDESEFEVSVFGPGHGECIVLHLGKGAWVVVDSHRDGETNEPVALRYLQTLGVNVAEQVKMVVATHWHDDHMDGLGDLFEECESAKFVCTMAMQREELKTLIETYRGQILNVGSGVDEMRQVLDELDERAPKGNVPAPVLAIEGRVLLTRNDDLPFHVHALAPSDAGVGVMLTRIQQKQLPKENRRRLRVPMLDENDASVVLAVRVGSESVLLGGDLEERGRGGIGWQVILDHHPAEGGRFDGFKIPHHGSDTGYHPDVWPRLMHDESWAAVTPYNKLKNPLPTPADCQRILQTAKYAYISAAPGLTEYRHDQLGVRETELAATLAIAEEPGLQGQIRLRKRLGDDGKDWTVELFGNAAPLALLMGQQ